MLCYSQEQYDQATEVTEITEQEDLNASAESKFQAAQAQLQKMRAGSGTAADIRQAQANLQAAQVRLDTLKNPSPVKFSAAIWLPISGPRCLYQLHIAGGTS
ncbi:MAG: hypothetical protein M3R61_17935 [Chloroflexota bacterium]|nr:hypothetical protein [Chloroflexota bacterium]